MEPRGPGHWGTGGDNSYGMTPHTHKNQNERGDHRCWYFYITTFTRLHKHSDNPEGSLAMVTSRTESFGAELRGRWSWRRRNELSILTIVGFFTMSM